MSRLIAKTDVTYALGYSPYDASNPLGFSTLVQMTNALAGYATQTSVAAQIAAVKVPAFPLLATVATSGLYSDLSGKPPAYSLQPASLTTLGGMQPDGVDLQSNAGVVSLIYGNTFLRMRQQYALDRTNTFDIRTYGAVCNGTTDDGPAIQLAVNAAQTNGGGIVLFPARLIRCDSQVSITQAGLHLLGAGWSEDASYGTQILTTVPTTVFQFAGTNARGGSIRGMGFKQVHPMMGPGWAPTAYPPTILIFNTNGQVTIDDVFCQNCYDFIRSLGSGRTKIGSIYGQPLHRGLYIDGSYDTTHVDHIHFWPYWTPVYNNADGTRNPGSYVIDWMTANSAGIELARVDGFQANAVFVYGYGDGILMSFSTLYAPNSGSPTIPQIAAFYPDGCKYGIRLTGQNASAHIGSIYTGGENLINGPIPGSFAIYFQGVNGSLSIGSAKLFFTDTYAVVMDQTGGGNTLMIANLEMTLINQGALVPTLMFSQNTTVPNIIRIANAPASNQSRGQSFINICNAWVDCPGNTPYIVAPVSGATVNVKPSRTLTIIEPSGSLAALTVVLPDTYAPMGVITVVATQNIAAVTWTSTNSIIVAPPASLSSGQARSFIYNPPLVTETGGTSAWFTM